MMYSFKIVYENSIKKKKRTREYYEAKIAECTEAELLTVDEATELIELLNEYYPVAPTESPEPEGE